MGGSHSSERRSSGERNSGAGSSGSSRSIPRAVATRTPQIRCYHCQGIFPMPPAAPQVHHVPCPYCATVNGVPAARNDGNSATMGALAAAMSSVVDLPPDRAQEREITPLELLILREFVEHLQHNRAGATMRDIE